MSKASNMTGYINTQNHLEELAATINNFLLILASHSASEYRLYNWVKVVFESPGYTVVHWEECEPRSMLKKKQKVDLVNYWIGTTDSYANMFPKQSRACMAMPSTSKISNTDVWTYFQHRPSSSSNMRIWLQLQLFANLNISYTIDTDYHSQNKKKKTLDNTGYFYLPRRHRDDPSM